LDVGQGDAAYIKTPQGVDVLIDAGRGQQVLRSLSRVLPFYDRTLDVVVITHPDADHIGGLPALLARYQVNNVVVSSMLSDSAVFEESRTRIAQEGANLVVVDRPLSLRFSDGVEFSILFPDRALYDAESNSASVVGKLMYGEHDILFMGDAPKEIERYLLSRYGSLIESEVLKVGHHGSKTSTDPEFVLSVAPSLEVMSAGKDNRYGHPHDEVLDALSGVLTLQTAQNGTVSLYSDGEVLKVKTENDPTMRVIDE
jgi:competence protein ComEC